MSKNNDAAPQNDQQQDPVITTAHQDASAARLKAEDPEAYAEIYGDIDAAAAKGPARAEGEGEQQQGEQQQAAPLEQQQGQQAAPAQGQGQQQVPAQQGGEPMVPLSRLNEVLRKVDQLSAQVQQQGAGQQQAAPAQTTPPAAPVFDLKAKLKEKQQAIWDGDEDKAIEIELEIENHRQKVATDAAIAAFDQRQQVQTTVQTLTTVATQLVEEYPALNSKAEGANLEAIAAVQRERDVQLAAGAEPAVALRRAVRTVAEEMGLQRVAPPQPQQGQGGQQQGAQGQLPANQQITARQVDVARFASATANTPPVGAGGQGEGDRARGAEDEVLSKDAWAALDPAEKDRRLGLR